MLLLGIGLGISTMTVLVACSLRATSVNRTAVAWCVLQLRRLRNDLRDVADVDSDPQLAAAARRAHAIAARLRRTRGADVPR